MRGSHRVPRGGSAELLSILLLGLFSMGLNRLQTLEPILTGESAQMVVYFDDSILLQAVPYFREVVEGYHHLLVVPCLLHPLPAEVPSHGFLRDQGYGGFSLALLARKDYFHIIPPPESLDRDCLHCSNGKHLEEPLSLNVPSEPGLDSLSCHELVLDDQLLLEVEHEGDLIELLHDLLLLLRVERDSEFLLEIIDHFLFGEGLLSRFLQL